MSRRISVIIPNYNGVSTVGKCIESVLSSDYPDFEVIIVDDCSSDNSVEVIKKYPCKLIELDRRSGASKARNTGAENSNGDILFFIDADCLVLENTLSLVDRAYNSRDRIIGGTYTNIPYDDSFFSTFQSIFVHYSETKRSNPDYVATHALVIDSGLFKASGGFSENFLPILEDVEFSHRLRRAGYTLSIDNGIMVRHIFNFTFMKSMRNAYRKSLYWTIYSLRNRDILTDSGTASAELKTNVVSLALIILFIMLSLFYGSPALAVPVPLISTFNVVASRGLLAAFYRNKGFLFATSSSIYYLFIFPLAVGSGAASGILHYALKFRAGKGNL